MAVVSFFSVSNAQLPSFGTLDPSGHEVLVPAVPPPSRGGQVSGAIDWDPSAPYSYWQNRASVIFSGDGTVEVKNVRSGGVPEDHKSYSWGSITVRPDLLDKAVYAYRTAGTGHTFLVFTFRDGGAVGGDGRSVTALTFGAEGFSREPYGYNIVQALAGRYPLIWNVTTFRNYAEFEAYKKKDTFFKSMNLDRARSRDLFSLTLERVNETNRNGEFYNLFTNSCTNNPVNLINRVVPEEQRISLEAAGLMNPAASIPVMAAKKYEKKGVLKPGSERMGPDNHASFDITKI